MNRLGILTGGGDAAGINAAIRGAVKTTILSYGTEIYRIKNGFERLLSEDGVYPLSLEPVRGILLQGGTILGAANRGNPFARKVKRAGESVIVDVSDQVIARINDLNLDCLIVIGGDGTLGDLSSLGGF